MALGNFPLTSCPERPHPPFYHASITGEISSDTLTGLHQAAQLPRSKNVALMDRQPAVPPPGEAPTVSKSSPPRLMELRKRRHKWGGIVVIPRNVRVDGIGVPTTLDYQHSAQYSPPSLPRRRRLVRHPVVDHYTSGSLQGPRKARCWSILAAVSSSTKRSALGSHRSLRPCFTAISAS